MPTKEELISAFKSFDLNKDGVITLDEFVHVLCTDYGDRGAPLPREVAVSMFRNADRDGDGVVSFEEFAIGWAEEKKQQIGQAVEGALAALESEIFPQYRSLEQAFSSMDANGDGVLSRQEFASALKSQLGGQLSDEDAMLLATKYDLNGERGFDSRCLRVHPLLLHRRRNLRLLFVFHLLSPSPLHFPSSSSSFSSFSSWSLTLRGVHRPPSSR